MSEASFLMRPAVPGDRNALGRLGALLFRTHYAFDRLRFMTPPEQLEEGYAAFLETQLRRDDAVVLVAEQQGRVVGYVYAGVEPLSWVALRDEAGFIHVGGLEPAPSIERPLGLIRGGQPARDVAGAGLCLNCLILRQLAQKTP